MIAILDYGVGNLRSVYKAFEKVAEPLQIPVDVVDAPTDLTKWRAVVLPGQGAFGDSINNVRGQGFESPLLDAVEAGLPLLGICVGMQLLFDESEEMGQHEGLHIIPGKVRRFADNMADDHILDAHISVNAAVPARPQRSLRVPQIGWNQLHQRETSLNLVDPLLADVPNGAYAYFAHSYFCDVEEPSTILATTDYGIDYPSIVRYKNAWGIQPHPEKSHTVGLQILSNFMQTVMMSESIESESIQSQPI